MHVCDTWSSPERNLTNQFWHYRSFKPFFHNFLWACDAFFLCENKKAKYDVPFDFPFFNERQTKTTQPIKKLFLPIDSWIANYRITKCVLQPKNWTEAIYEWNPQLLSCQPNTKWKEGRGSIRILLSFDYRSKRNIGSRGGKIRVTMRWFVEIYRVCHAIRQISSLTWKGSGNGWTGRKGVTTNNLLSCSLPSPSPFVGRRESSDISFHLFVPLFVRIEQPSPLLQFETPSNLLLRTCLAFDPALPYCPHWYRRL